MAAMVEPLRMPVLSTPRLRIRDFATTDLEAVHQLLDRDIAIAGESSRSREQRRVWLEWTVLSYAQLAELDQPPYGDRAIVRAATDRIIGACGLVPCLVPRLGSEDQRVAPEVGMYWAVAPALQRQGYATEAARALVAYAFGELRLRRLIAMTTFDNEASMGVMRKLGMRITRNPRPEPAWFQVCGVLDA